MTEIKALLFDKDGTLFDFSATWEAWAAGFLTRLSAGSGERAIALGHRIGFDFENRKFSPDSIVIAGTPAEVVQMLAPQVPELSPDALLDLLNEEAEMAPQLEAVPLLPLLKLLREKGLALGVATNDAEAPAQAHLAEAGITDMFDFIAGFDSGHGAKPGPGQLLAFASKIGVEPGHIAMIGDSTHDMVAGRAAGMVCIAVLTGLATSRDLEGHADVVLRDIGDLPDWLDTRSR